jgi:hypothetical protein
MCPDIADTIDKLVDEKFILCESGPKGGDVQIAHVRGITYYLFRPRERSC